MALQDIFKFRELPESETSKPFLEHLEDLRWTVVKMAIALLLAMMACFAFRSMLVQVMQAPLHAVDPQVGALKALGITDSFVISFHLAFYAGIVVSFPLLFYRAIRSSRADRSRETFFISSNPRELWPLSAGRTRLLFLVASENDSLLFPRHPIAGMGADLDGAAILFFRNEIRSRFRIGV